MTWTQDPIIYIIAVNRLSDPSTNKNHRHKVKCKFMLSVQITHRKECKKEEEKGGRWGEGGKESSKGIFIKTAPSDNNSLNNLTLHIHKESLNN